MFGFKPKHTIEKLVASNAPEIIDPNLIAEVFNVWNQHDKELTDVWRLMNPQSREELVSVFLKELEKEFRREFSELNSENVMTIMMEDLKTSIKGAFAAGYMTGKGWISLDHLSNFNLCIGDKVLHLLTSCIMPSWCS